MMTTRLERRVVLAVLVGVASVAGWIGLAIAPGSIAAARGSGRNSCSMEDEMGRHLLIEPQSSHMSCREIKQLLVLLPDAPGVWPLYSNGTVTEVCWIYKPNPTIQLRCHKRGRRGLHFDVVYVAG